jgi:hypothetical protein
MASFPDLPKTDIEWHEFEWLNVLVQAWSPGLVVAAGDLIRPTVPNGFFYAANAGGQLGGREPAWNAQAGATTQNGSVTLTAQTPGTASEPTIASCTYAMTPSGLVEDDTQIDNDRMVTRIRIDATGADTGDYTITATMTDSTGEDHVRSATLTVTD